jgi:hypothetical protein
MAIKAISSGKPALKWDSLKEEDIVSMIKANEAVYDKCRDPKASESYPRKTHDRWEISLDKGIRGYSKENTRCVCIQSIYPDTYGNILKKLREGQRKKIKILEIKEEG